MSGGDRPTFEFLADDVVVMHPTGDLSRAEEIKTLLGERAKQGRFFIVADFNGVKKLHSEAGSKGNQIVNPDWLAGAVFLNASMTVRLGLKVYNLATILTGRNQFPVEYVNSMDEALAAIQRMREAAGEQR